MKDSSFLSTVGSISVQQQHVTHSPRKAFPALLLSLLRIVDRILIARIMSIPVPSQSAALRGVLLGPITQFMSSGRIIM
jgi:hypothetical protein